MRKWKYDLIFYVNRRALLLYYTQTHTAYYTKPTIAAPTDNYIILYRVRVYLEWRRSGGGHPIDPPG